MIIGYEIYALRQSGAVRKYKIVLKSEVKAARCELREWINGWSKRYIVRCLPIYA